MWPVAAMAIALWLFLAGGLTLCLSPGPEVCSFPLYSSTTRPSGQAHLSRNSTDFKASLFLCSLWHADLRKGNEEKAHRPTLPRTLSLPGVSDGGR
ncbi:hypothetical protein P167DRAFT_99248 [Morchella conica CCBAS932]|uniref:Uncharacterized protein n=1 Tax=Morchella conica CCBAS932 TaxID=1392247 RepID=A0A3N4KB70_9PEZI|nr:hypothetical protein P167DRAFT_99248 [Morchella conica CCBAS932]